MLYVVFDTNVIVSAMLSHNPLAPTIKVVEAISLGKIVPLSEFGIIYYFIKINTFIINNYLKTFNQN